MMAYPSDFEATVVQGDTLERRSLIEGQRAMRIDKGDEALQGKGLARLVRQANTSTKNDSRCAYRGCSGSVAECRRE